MTMIAKKYKCAQQFINSVEWLHTTKRLLPLIGMWQRYTGSSTRKLREIQHRV